MSWSFTAVGKPMAVLAKAQKEILESTYKCPEPEETVRKNVVAMLEKVLPPMPANVAVQITASGSQYTPSEKAPGEVINNFTFEIKPLWGFAE